jgi:glycosyltransferase involved in cell wall biosynthesis
MSGPRLAGVFPLTLEPLHIGKDPVLIPLGMRERGWAVELHAPAVTGDGWPVPVHTAPLSELGDPGYWAERGLDAAIATTFIDYGGPVAALRAAGVRAIAKGDTDGLLAPRAFPRKSLPQAIWARGGPLRRAASLAYWAMRAGPWHGREMRKLRGLVESADAFSVESGVARDRIRLLLERSGAPELAERLHVVLAPIRPAFTRGEVPRERDELVVAIGRWEDPQKNPRLMAGALQRFLRSHPGYRAVVLGAGATGRFGGLGEQVSAVEHADAGGLLELLRRARIVVSSSRWESFSLAAHEGLASGCSVAAPPLAPFLQMAAGGPYATIQRGRGPDGLAATVAAEARAWEAGERDPVAIAAHWRDLVDVDAVARRYEELLGTGRRA